MLVDFSYPYRVVVKTEMDFIEPTHQMITDAWLFVSSVPAATAYEREQVANDRIGAP